MAEGAEVTLIDCEFDENHGAGVSITPDTTLRAQGVRVRRNGGAGLEVRSREDACRAALLQVEDADLPESLRATIRTLIEQLSEADSEPTRRSKYNQIVDSLASHATILDFLGPLIGKLI